jgi:histidine triad (HIT) family protein
MEECIFCSIVQGGSKSFKVYENQDQIAFLDIHPLVRGHTLVVPKKHFDTLIDMDEHSIGQLFNTVKLVAMNLVPAMGAHGFRIMQNNGESAAQVVKHVHVHILPFKLGENSFGLRRLNLSEEEFNSIANTIRSSFKEQRPQTSL